MVHARMIHTTITNFLWYQPLGFEEPINTVDFTYEIDWVRADATRPRFTRDGRIAG